MPARNCIVKKGEAGIVNQDQARAAADLYDEQLAQLRADNTPNAESVAEQRTLEALKAQTLAKKRAALAQLQAQESIRGRLEGKGSETGAAALSLLDFDPRARHIGANVVQMGHDIENQAMARAAGFVERFRARFANLDRLPGVGTRRTAVMREVVRELFGESTGNAEAKANADGIAAGFEHLRQLWNASGGTIPELERWGLPQTHNRRLLTSIAEPGIEKLAPAERAARKAEVWADYITPLLDRQRMRDFNTGLPLSEPGLRRLLLKTYENVVTGGLSEVKPGPGGGLDFLGRRQESRFLHFKDADSWMQYQQRFGEDSPHDAILGHYRTMARDIAMLRVLGPSPMASVRYAEKLIAQGQGRAALEAVGNKAARLAGNLFGPAQRFRRMFDLVSGNLNHAENSTVAAIDETNRNIVMSAILGGAVFSKVSERAFTWATASLLDIPNGRVLARFVKMLNPASVEDQALAMRVGFGADDMAGTMVSAARYAGDFVNPSWSRTLADSILRASGLVRLTTAGRQAFQLEFLGALTRLRSRAFEDLPPGMRRGFGMYGVNKPDWNEFRSMEPWRDPQSGAQFLRPHDLLGDPDKIAAGPLFNRRYELANKIMGMINAERDFAVPVSSTRARADVLMGTRPGTVGGVLARNMGLLKSFPLSLVYQHLNRGLNAQLPRLTKAKFTAQVVLGGTILGALGQQMYEIAHGKDPMDMEDPKFWLKAATRGGGVGILGDFAFSDQNRFGGSFSDTLLGPVLGEEIPKAANLTLGSGQQMLMTGTTKGKGKELSDFARVFTPGHSLWYTNLAMDRLIFDEVQRQIDPNYAESFSRAEEAAMRDHHQRYYSPPGSGFPPPRGPDPSAAFGGSQ
jgi:hypothetical protein